MKASSALNGFIAGHWAYDYEIRSKSRGRAVEHQHRVSMADIARVAKVSPSTVSRALSGHPKVSDTARKLVLETADRLGYVRNLGAASLASSKCDAIGLLIRDVGNEFYGGLASCVQYETDDTGLSLLLALSEDSLESQLAAVRNLLGHGVGGIIIASGRISSQTADYAAKFVPTVVLATGYDMPSFSSVRIDPRCEGSLARRVVEQGHKKVAVTASADVLASALHARTANFLTGLVVAGAQATILSLPSHIEDVIGAEVDKAIDSGVTAIMAGNDSIALSILEHLDAIGVSCPGYVSVTGFDGVGTFRSPLLGLTTMEQPVGELARAAVSLMKDLLDNDSGQPHQVLVDGKFVVGRTLGPVRSEQ
ncbi:LacI family DNA-binding transcriptional regulator [Bifidobacterium mizhiense]|uniref:LacI family DNA-binding transcriptional regulator n=1 Tax=Bifidobacterium mizhiense TaxID=2879940 RepID=UPI001E35D950|nr:LacI family DNA-binding transcriptional regulator [Bifidobacterium mizhiense]